MIHVSYVMCSTIACLNEVSLESNRRQFLESMSKETAVLQLYGTIDGVLLTLLL